MKNSRIPDFLVSRGQVSTGRRRQLGITLMEWMISITIGLILLAGLTALIARQSSTQAELEKSSRQIENGRYAMQLLNEDIQMAGYYGEFSKVSDLAVPGTLPDPCLKTAASIEPAMPFAVQGYDFPSVTTVLPTCIDAANHASGTDILVVRRVEPATSTIAAAASAAGGQIYLQAGMTPSGLEFTKKMGTGANAGGTAVFTLTNKDGATLASLRKFLVHIYFVSPCSVMAGSTCTASDDGGKPIPTLKMLELSASGNTTTMTITPLVEGVENMQIDYGFDASDATADGSPDGQFVAAPATLAKWADLVALRIHLLARNNEATTGYVDTKTYTMGYDSTAAVQVVTPATSVQSYKRRVFSQLIRVVNPSSRRDS